MKETFVKVVNLAMESAEGIVEMEHKAMVYAELAKAIAMAMGNSSIGEVPSEPKEKKQKGSKKDAIKQGADKVEGTVQEQQSDVPQVQEQTEPATPVSTVEEDSEEWTEAMQTKYAEELTKLGQYVEAWGEDYVYGECVKGLTEGQFEGMDYVTPLSINVFIQYLDRIAQMVAEQQQ